MPLNPPYILDIDHENVIPSFDKAALAGLKVVIHKWSQGLWMTDGLYRQRQTVAIRLGLLWGAYHFGEYPDPVKQADILLDVVADSTSTILCLDLEPNRLNRNGSMDLKGAEAFVERVHDMTERWPLIYTANYYIDDIGGHKSEILKNCPLWVAAPNSVPLVPKPWSDWTLWQFTNGVVGPEPHKLPGLGQNDLSIFNGTEDQLVKWWLLGKVPDKGGIVTEKVMVVNTAELHVRRQAHIPPNAPNSNIVDTLHQGDSITVDLAKGVTADGHLWYPVTSTYFVASEFLTDPK